MAGQVMDAHQAHQQLLQPPAMPPFANPSCKNAQQQHHHLTATTTAAAVVGGSGGTGTTAAAAADDVARYLQQLQNAAAEANNNSSNGGGARGEQCPRCASHDTKFCYYNNYNTSQPRHFCRACRRYWTLGGSLRNVPIGGSTRKRPRLAHHHHLPARRAPVVCGGFGGLGGGGPAMPPPPQQQQQGGLLSSLFALGEGAPLLEGRGGFDLGLGLLPSSAGPFGAGGEAGMQMQMQSLGLRGSGGGGPAGAPPSFLWPAARLLDGESMDAWKLPGAAGMWPAEFSSPAAATPAPAAQAGGLLHGGAQLM